MINDRKLLELAAKAAGINIEQGYGDPPENCLFYQDSAGGCHDWNPLKDDGDALRLAVKLNICVFNNTYASWAATGSLQEVRGEELHNGGVDPYAATRRAIVRAAAEIGRAMP